jgi:hypothetical protein
VDPAGTIELTEGVGLATAARGCAVYVWSQMCRAAAVSWVFASTLAPSWSFRLVRSLD